MKLHLLIIFSNRKLFRAYLSAILLLAVIPLNSSEKLNNITIISLRGDYFFHALLFCPWAFFLPAFGKNVLSWLVMGLLFAAFAEGLQYFLTYRAFNVNDLAANLTGVLIGLMIYFPVRHFLKKK